MHFLKAHCFAPTY